MDFALYFRFLFALGLVLGLIFLISWAVRRFGPGARLLPNAGRERRLAIVEVATLDARRRLILLRRDSAEYLVLLGPTQDLLLDKDFQADPAREPASGNGPPEPPSQADLSVVRGNGPK